MDLVTRAAHYAARAHRDQRRKSAAAHPYINHPLDVAALLAGTGAVTDADVLCAGLLHDVVEDTEVTLAELTRDFGAGIAGIVAECSDDKALPKEARKEAQVQHAAGASLGARLVKLADKLSNLRDLASPQGWPVGWSAARVKEYFAWAARVVHELRGTNAPLEAALDAVFAQQRAAEQAEADSAAAAAAAAAAASAGGPAAAPAPARNSTALDDLYAESSPPPGLAAEQRRLAAFLAAHRAAGRAVALVTSGGTLVPLEARMVRFLDNFSTGLRGASLAEGLLSAGYAVCFLHREGSKRPLLHGVLGALASGMGSLSSVDLSSAGSEWALGVAARQEGGAAAAPAGAAALGLVPAAAAEPGSGSEGAQQPRLLELTFLSVQDYLFKLRAAALACQEACSLPAPPGFLRTPLLILAAAVSDFYLPEALLPSHKIQSRGSGGAGELSGGDGAAAKISPAGELLLRLSPTPKALAALSREWCPGCSVVSFKLETDEALLLQKAQAALDSTAVACVVANLLDSRHTEVRVVQRQGRVAVLRAAAGGAQTLEAQLASALVDLHAGGSAAT